MPPLRRCACGRRYPSAQKVCPDCGAPAPLKPPLTPRQRAAARDLWMEAHLKAVSVWDRIWAVLLGVVGLALGVLALAALSTSEVLALAIGAAAAACLIGGGGLFVLGLFLSRFNNVARILGGVLAVLGMIGNVVEISGGENVPSNVGALLWGAAHGWVHFSPRAARVCSPEYAKVIAGSAWARPPVHRSVFFWLMPTLFLLAVLIGVVGGIVAAA